MKVPSSRETERIRRRILRFYEQHGADLPWRTTADPYRITVAELMLQQTQVERVIPKYQAWVRRWPSWQALAKAGNRELLAVWSGLGYNRRALYLGQIARVVVLDHGGKLPSNWEALKELPGIGPYTAKAVMIFAFNVPLAAIDTNVRRVLIHELSLPPTISAGQLEEIALLVLPKRRSRDWHNALMDYGRMVLSKRSGSTRGTRRQTQFEGSIRQIRGEIIRRLTKQESVTLKSIADALERSQQDVHRAARSLEQEGIIVIRNKTVRLTER